MPCAVIAQVDAARVDALVEGLDRLGIELEPLGQLGELGQVDAPRLLAALDQV